MTMRPATARFKALGTTVSLAVTEPNQLGLVTDIVRAHVDALDMAASRFRDDSELVALHGAAGRPMRVSPLLFTVIEDALEAAAATEGLVDPTVGRALELCGYDRDFRDVAPTGPPLRISYRQIPGWRAISLNRRERTVSIPTGVRLDLGATAKAGCADRAARAAAAAVGSGVLVNLGGDLAVDGPPPADGWVIRVTDCHDAPLEELGAKVAIHGGGLATSSTSARRWSRGGEVLHHVIDPATGAPATACWRTVSVVADTCLAANVASTAAIILGPSAPVWLNERGYHARLVHEGGTVVAVGQWPHDALVAPEEPALAS
jgi:thiamine biosynthesis lipoprotein ApbE